MAGKAFYLNKRAGIYYARFKDPETGTLLPAKSTGEKDRDLAGLKAFGWLKEGLPTARTTKAKPLSQAFSLARLLDQVKTADLSPADAGKIVDILKGRGLLEQIRKTEDRDFLEWLKEFWDYDKSPYVREKKAHGQTIGKRHCKEMANRVDYYQAFKGKHLSEVTRHDLKALGLDLSNKNLSALTVNKIMDTAKIALAWAFREGLILSDPTVRLPHFTATSKKRDILTEEEASILFEAEWKEDRAKVGNLVSATCGLRSGEVLALRVEDIGSDRLFIRHSWSSLDGLKSPKNGEERQVPLLPHVRASLLDLARENPWDDGFIFWSMKEGQPMDQKFLLDGFYEALEKIGITVEQRKARNLVFHSWRHRYAARMSEQVDARSLGLATGHKTPAMLEHYANHANEEHFAQVKEATERAFGKPNK